MPNVAFWLSDKVYEGWLNLPKEQQKALKTTFKKTIARAVKVEYHAPQAA